MKGQVVLTLGVERGRGVRGSGSPVGWFAIKVTAAIVHPLPNPRLSAAAAAGLNRAVPVSTAAPATALE